MTSLEMDPCLWVAYKQLCELGANIEASQFFGTANCFNENSGRADDKFEPRLECHDEDSESRQLFDEERGSQNDAEDRPTDAMTLEAPKLRPRFHLRTSQSTVASTFRSSRPLAHKTPNRMNNMHTTVVITDAHVGKGIKVSARHRKSRRRPLTETDDKLRARLSFSAGKLDDSPLVLNYSGCRLLTTFLDD